MKKFKKSLALLIVASLFLPACRTKDPITEVKRYDGVELTYYKVFDDSEVMEPIIIKFQTSHPGLKINYRKFSNFEEYQTTILNELAEGEGPDIFSMQNTWFASNTGKLSPLPESLGGPKDFEATFVDVAYDDLVLADGSGQSQIYGLPMYVDTLALYYNKDHFEDRLPAKGRPSATWEGIKEDAFALTKADNSFDRFEVAGLAMGGAEITRAVDILYLLFLQYETEFYNEDGSEATFAEQQSLLDPFPAIKALDLYLSFADEGQRNYSWSDLVIADDVQGAEVEAFAEGRISMMIGYSFMYDDILNQISLLNTKGVDTIDKDAIRIAAIPQLVDPNVSTEKRVTYANYFAETVSRNSEHPELAWEFLLEVTSKENLAPYFDKTHKPTSRRDMIEEQKLNPTYGVFVNQIGFAESFPIVDYGAYSEIFKNLIIKANAGGNVRNDLNAAQDLIDTILPADGFLAPLADE